VSARGNGFRAKGEPSTSVLAGRSRCLGTRLATHRSKFTISASVEMHVRRNAPQSCRVWKRISRGTDVTDKRSVRSIGLRGHVPGVSPEQIRNCLARRTIQRTADMSSAETSVA
jgi:hypothetical protein